MTLTTILIYLALAAFLVGGVLILKRSKKNTISGIKPTPHRLAWGDKPNKSAKPENTPID